jgi:thiamine-phosphate pyrophosphorylase
VSLQRNSSSAPILCYVTDRNSLRPDALALETLLPKIEAAIAAGVDWIQLREKDLSGKDFAALTRSAVACASRAASSPAQTKILVNDRLDVALVENANGVHLGERSLPVQHARHLANKHRASNNPPFLIGVSCHAINEAQAAATSGADYLIFGPIFDTPSKAAFGPPQGLERLAEICSAVSIPVLAIGGVTLQNAPSCLAAGAAGIAAVRLFQDASAGLPDLVCALHALPRR